MISKHFILSMGLLAAIGVGSTISSANAQFYPPQDRAAPLPPDPLDRLYNVTRPFSSVSMKEMRR